MSLNNTAHVLELKWRCPILWGSPEPSIISCRIFREINHPAVGLPPHDLGNLQVLKDNLWFSFWDVPCLKNHPVTSTELLTIDLGFI